MSLKKILCFYMISVLMFGCSESKEEKPAVEVEENKEEKTDEQIETIFKENGYVITVAEVYWKFLINNHEKK